MATEVRSDRPLRLKNVVCPYCGDGLSTANGTKEHVIGRGFVPKGLLENQWNLILNACARCNSEKSGLEDDISAISMLPDLRGRHHSEHPQLAVDAKSKAHRSRSRFSGTLVAGSQVRHKVRLAPFDGISMTIDLVGPPHIDPNRAFELARLQFAAFFYFMTYNHDEKRGWWWRGRYAPLQFLPRSDWGNLQAVTFAKITSNWGLRFVGATASGHFRVAIRKSPTEDIWSLAVEWNCSYRVIAMCGEDEPLEKFMAALPRLHATEYRDSAGNQFRVRDEWVLSPDEDILFEIEPCGHSHVDKGTPSLGD